MAEYTIVGTGRKTLGTESVPLASTPCLCAFVRIGPAVKTGPAASNSDAILVGPSNLGAAPVHLNLVIAPTNYEGEYIHHHRVEDLYVKTISGSNNVWWTAFGRR